MDEDRFWEIVQRVHDISAGDMDRKCVALRQQIAALSKEGALEFGHLFDAMMNKAYRWPLWDAAYVIHGRCSNDTFTDFRSSLISRGRQAYERASADPESFAEENFDEQAWFYEGYQYAVTEGVIAVAGKRLRRHAHPVEPSGVEWPEDKIYALFPKLSATFAR